MERAILSSKKRSSIPSASREDPHKLVADTAERPVVPLESLPHSRRPLRPQIGREEVLAVTLGVVGLVRQVEIAHAEHFLQVRRRVVAERGCQLLVRRRVVAPGRGNAGARNPHLLLQRKGEELVCEIACVADHAFGDAVAHDGEEADRLQRVPDLFGDPLLSRRISGEHRGDVDLRNAVRCHRNSLPLRHPDRTTFARAGARTAVDEGGTGAGAAPFESGTLRTLDPTSSSTSFRMKLQSVLLGTTLTMLLALHASTIDTLLPAIPDIRSEFTVGAGAGQLSISAFVYAFAAVQLVYGPLSDRFGRRSVLLWSMSLFTLGTVLAFVAGSFETLVMSRIIQGIGAGAAPAVARAVVRDIYGPERSGQVLSYIMAAFGIIAVANPIVGGVLTDWFGWRAIFVYMTAYGTAILVLVWWRLAETLPARQVGGLGFRRLLGNYRVMLTDRRFVTITICTCCIHAAMFGWLSGSVLVFIDSWGATPSLAGTYISISLGGFILGSMVAGRISNRLGSTRLIDTGNLICLSSAAIAVVLAYTGVQSAPYDYRAGYRLHVRGRIRDTAGLRRGHRTVPVDGGRRVVVSGIQPDQRQFHGHIDKRVPLRRNDAAGRARHDRPGRFRTHRLFPRDASTAGAVTRSPPLAGLRLAPDAGQPELLVTRLSRRPVIVIDLREAGFTSTGRAMFPDRRNSRSARPPSPPRRCPAGSS